MRGGRGDLQWTMAMMFVYSVLPSTIRIWKHKEFVPKYSSHIATHANDDDYIEP